MSDQVEMAFAFDAFTPTIILPASAEEWSDDRRRAVLLHELAHIRRRDLIGHVIAGLPARCIGSTICLGRGAASVRE
jgi:beta-lactamase regulating signal transducer with metallopeptidase domain